MTKEVIYATLSVASLTFALIQSASTRPGLAARLIPVSTEDTTMSEPNENKPGDTSADMFISSLYYTMVSSIHMIPGTIWLSLEVDMVYAQICTIQNIILSLSLLIYNYFAVDILICIKIPD